MVEIKEIEYRASRARLYYKYLEDADLAYQWEWCLHMGLWETSGWTDKNNRNKMFRWLDSKE